MCNRQSCFLVIFSDFTYVTCVCECIDGTKIPHFIMCVYTYRPMCIYGLLARCAFKYLNVCFYWNVHVWEKIVDFDIFSTPNAHAFTHTHKLLHFPLINCNIFKALFSGMTIEDNEGVRSMCTRKRRKKRQSLAVHPYLRTTFSLLLFRFIFGFPICCHPI